MPLCLASLLRLQFLLLYLVLLQGMPLCLALLL
jgi:hypothetical protein